MHNRYKTLSPKKKALKKLKNQLEISEQSDEYRISIQSEAEETHQKQIKTLEKKEFKKITQFTQT